MTVATVWTANTAKSLGNIVCPTNGVDGMFFRVTTAGTTGAGEPSSYKFVCETWNKSIPYLNRATIQATFREVFEP